MPLVWLQENHSSI